MNFLPRIATAVISAFLVITGAAVAHSAEVSLSWQAPTSNTDGSTVTDINGYRIYVGTAPNAYTRSDETVTEPAATVGSLNEGQTYYFAVTAFDSTGTESEFSNEVSHTIPAATPAPAPSPEPAPEPVPATSTPTPTQPTPTPTQPTPTPTQPTPTPTQPTPPPVVGGIAKGDVDGNGVITMPDVLAALQMAVGDGVFSPEMTARADVWPLASGLPLGNGKVGLDDCLAILRKVVQPGAW